MVELVGGVAIGVGLGWVGVQILRREALPSAGLYPLATIALWRCYAVGCSRTPPASWPATSCAVVLGNARGAAPLGHP